MFDFPCVDTNLKVAESASNVNRSNEQSGPTGPVKTSE